MDNNPTQSTRQCPYCGEDIQPGAIKCKHCNEWLVNNPPPTPKSPEELAKEQKDKRDQKMVVGGCLTVFLVGLAGIILLVVLIAKWTVPDEEQHRRSIRKEVLECVDDKVDETLGFVGATLLSPFTSMAMKTDYVQSYLLDRFDQSNRIEYIRGTFTSEARIINRIYPEGETISFGFFGMVFPSFDWDDIAILTDAESKDIMKFFSDLTSSDPSSSGSSSSTPAQSPKRHQEQTSTPARPSRSEPAVQEEELTTEENDQSTSASDTE